MKSQVSSQAVKIENCFSVRKSPCQESRMAFHTCKQFASRSTIVIDATEGSWIEVERKRWHGGREWCQMWCKLGLRDANGTRLMLFDAKHSERARYIVQISNDSPCQNVYSDSHSDLERHQLLTLPCYRALGTDCDRPDKVI